MTKLLPAPDLCLTFIFIVEFMRQTYLYRLWQHDRLLGTAVWCFLLGQVFFWYKGVETFPFYHFGMYAAPAPPKKQYRATHLRLGDSDGTYLPLRQLGNPTFWEYQLRFYTQLRQDFPPDQSLRQTIQRRFSPFPALESYALTQLCNDSTDLQQMERLLSRNLAFVPHSLCQENFEWVNGNFKLVNQTLFYQWKHPRQ